MILIPNVQGIQAQIERAHSGLVGRSKLMFTPTSTKSKRYSTVSEKMVFIEAAPSVQSRYLSSYLFITYITTAFVGKFAQRNASANAADRHQKIQETEV